MKVIFIGAGPGDPELLTIKAQRIIEKCRICIYAGSLISPQVIALIPSDAQLYNSASMSLEQIVSVFESARELDCDVVRLHTGDTSIFSAIGEQIVQLKKRAISYEIIPGISSFQAAAAALGVELTVPQKSQTIVLTRTAGRTPMPELQDLERFAEANVTLCIFLSVHAIKDIAKRLAVFYSTTCPVAVVFHASWSDELVIRGTLEDIAIKVVDAGISKTALIIAGPALSEGTTQSKLYDAGFSHEYRKAVE